MCSVFAISITLCERRKSETTPYRTADRVEKFLGSIEKQGPTMWAINTFFSAESKNLGNILGALVKAVVNVVHNVTNLVGGVVHDVGGLVGGLVHKIGWLKHWNMEIRIENNCCKSFKLIACTF